RASRIAHANPPAWADGQRRRAEVAREPPERRSCAHHEEPRSPLPSAKDLCQADTPRKLRSCARLGRVRLIALEGVERNAVPRFRSGWRQSRHTSSSWSDNLRLTGGMV